MPDPATERDEAAANMHRYINWWRLGKWTTDALSMSLRAEVEVYKEKNEGDKS